MTDTARSDPTGAQRGTGNRAHPGGLDLRTLALGALGVVHGDIFQLPNRVVELGLPIEL